MKWPIVGAYVAVVVSLFIFAAIWMSENYTKPAATVSNRMDSRIGGAMADAIGNNAAVKSFGAETREAERFRALANRWRTVAMVCWYRFTNAWLVSNLLLIALQSGLLALLVWMWTSGKAGAGDVAFAIAVAAGDERPSAQFRRAGADDAARASARSRTWRSTPAPRRRSPTRPTRRHSRRARARSCSRTWRSATRAKARRSTRTSTCASRRVKRSRLVGPTGAGKSTFVA